MLVSSDSYSRSNPTGAYYGRSAGWNPVYQNPIRGQRGYRGQRVGLSGGGFAAVNMHFLTAALKNLEPRIDDDFIDRINYYYSPSVIIIFAILVSAKQYVGHPIECWVPAQFTKAMEQYTENYCWIQNTYWVPFMDLIPMKIGDRERKQIGYYQWVPFILAIQALLFYLPALIWRMLSTQSGINVLGILQMACDEHNIEPDNRNRSIDILSRHIDDALQHQRDFGSKNKAIYLWACVKIGKFYGAYVSFLYTFVKLLYVLNVLGQFFLLNRFLETDEYPFFGAHVLWDMLNGREWQNSGKFPRVTLCDFEIRVLGNIHRHTVQCVLVINMFTEKIFVFLWLWFLLLFLANLISFTYWFVSLTLPHMRISFILKHLELTEQPPESDKFLRRFVLTFLRPDGVFVLRMLASHAGTVMCNEVVYAMWLRFRGIRKRAKTNSQVSIPSIGGSNSGVKFKDEKGTNTDGPLYKQVVPASVPTPAPRYDELSHSPTKLPLLESNHKPSPANPITVLWNSTNPSKLIGAASTKLPSIMTTSREKGKTSGAVDETTSFIERPVRGSSSYSNPQ